MKSYFLAGALISAMTSGAFAASYSTSFNDFGAPGSDVAGQDDWFINDTTDQFSQIATANVNYNAPATVSKTLNLGDASVVGSPPVVSTVALSHGYLGTVAQTQITFDYLLLDSSNGAFDNRDQFGVSISNGATDLFAINFIPDAQSADPDNDDAQWNVFYTVGAGSTVALPQAFAELSQLKFDLSFAANTDPLLTDFSLTIGSSINQLTAGATGLALNPNTTANQFNVLWSKVEDADFGSNSVFVDNLTVIPEPSSSLLFGFAAFAFAARRRRA